jgi:DNA-binding MarR family transcriptional regulator
MALLYGADEADFLYLLNESGLSKGNLSSHLQKLEKGGYVKIDKMFVGKTPRTVCRLTAAGRKAFRRYRAHLKEIAGQLG